MGLYLDSLPKDRRVVFPCVVSDRLAGMLTRRGFSPGDDDAGEIDVYERGSEPMVSGIKTGSETPREAVKTAEHRSVDSEHQDRAAVHQDREPRQEKHDGRYGPVKALDLFCCAGGASAGLIAAGYDVTGVDVEAQPEYPFRFVQGDALTFPLDGFDLIWASPPCQAFTAYKRRPGHVAPRPNLIPAIRARLRKSGIQYIIENVPGAPLENEVTLCGSMFGLDVRRHRIFETSFRVFSVPACRHAEQKPRFAQATNRTNLRRTVEVGVYRIPLAVQRRAMGIDWMSLGKLSQAIPPAYSEFLGRAATAARSAGIGAQP